MKTNKQKNKKNKNKVIENSKSICILQKLRSDYFLRKIYDYIIKNKSLELVKNNKKIQNRLNISLKDYKEYSELFTPIEIEIIPKKDYFGQFVNINNENEKFFYHIYFNDNKEEAKNKYKINKEDKVEKIKIIIDYQIKSFEKLFNDCECIESIDFKKFYRNNINNMSCMFSGCSSLKELNLNNFNTNNVTYMSKMFTGCSDDLKMKIKLENKNIKGEAFN